LTPIARGSDLAGGELVGDEPIAELGIVVESR
jgi:hypothetical protein